MRQILIRKKPTVDVKDGTLIVKTNERLILSDKAPVSYNFSGDIEVLSGTPRFEFKLSRSLAHQGAILLGAYQEDGVATAVLAVLQGMGEIELDEGEPLLVATSLDSDAVSAVDSGRFDRGVLLLDSVSQKPKKKKKKS